MKKIQIKQVVIHLVFLPLFLIRDTVQSNKSVGKKIFFLFLILFLFVTSWVQVFFTLRTLISSSLYTFGVTDKLTEVHTKGTSMLPTIKDGEKITLRSPKKLGLHRGDIISFINEGTDSRHFLKRIIALENEELSIKNGYVYINGKALEEKYTLANRPTFGNVFLPECETVTVPKGHVFVAGDNRTVSYDSRAIGFVRKDDIDGVIRKDYTQQFVTDQQAVSKSTITPLEFLETINKQREKEKLNYFVTNSVLNDLAQSRAEYIRDNFGEWKTNRQPLSPTLDEKGYKYNLVHEYVTFGYLTYDEIIQQIYDSPLEKDKFTTNTFTDIGIGISERTYQNCTYPVISIIVSWPSEPTYDVEVIQSWQKEITYTQTSLSQIQSWVGNSSKDQTKIRSVITSLANQHEIAARIHTRMNNRQWLTTKDYQDIKQFNEQREESNTLIFELFGTNVQGVKTKVDERKL